MKVSIITVVFNNRKTIKDTIVSVLSQSYQDIEYIIIDGASNDGTFDIINEFKDNVSKVVSEPDRGIYDAMNKGLRLASGDIIGILNGDDTYRDSDVVLNVVKEFHMSNADAVYGDLDYVDFDDISKVKRKWRSGRYKKNSFLWGWVPPHPSFFVSRKVYEKYGLFREDIPISADYEIMLRFIHRFQISVSYLPKVLVKMRQGGVSSANLRNRLAGNKEHYYAWRINGLDPYFFTIRLKPLRKIGQFFVFKK